MSNHKVGYRQPPLASRFKKGKSGNPAGRPKGRLNLASELKRELANRVTIRENGQPKLISKRAAVLKSLVAKALGGDVKAIGAIVELIARFEQFDSPADTVPVSSDEQRILRRFLPRALESISGKHKSRARKKKPK